MPEQAADPPVTRLLIEVTAHPGYALTLEFESRDVGATQGVTLTWADRPDDRDGVVVRYRAHTSHWTTALESAQEVAAHAYTRLRARGYWRGFMDAARVRDALVEGVRDDGGTPVDTFDPDDDHDPPEPVAGCGACRICGRVALLERDGRLGHHTPSTFVGWACRGVGGEPWDYRGEDRPT